MNQKGLQRMHITVTDVELQERISKVLETEQLTHSEFIKKYLKIPEDEWDIVCKHYDDFKILALSNLNGQRKDTQGLMDTFMGVLSNIKKGKLDPIKCQEALIKVYETSNK